MRDCAHMCREKCDVLIIGSGVVGLAIGIALLESKPSLRIRIVEKEKKIGLHASGRNSGVLHAGFYYSPDSLKAKFCRDGNLELRTLAKKYSIPVRDIGKIVVARNQEEAFRLNSLYHRGIANQVQLELLEATQLHKYEPLAKTCEKFLWSPTTAISDPAAIVGAMYNEFTSLGGKIDFEKKIFLEITHGEVHDGTNSYEAKHIINAAGAQADRISRSVGVGMEYAMIPFMGVYRETLERNLPLRHLVYPVPHPANPFLGVHFTLTFDGKVKIGPTAIPIAGREQYSLLEGWSILDLLQAFKGVLSLMKGDKHDFSSIMKSEWPKLFHSKLIGESAQLVPTATTVTNWGRKPPGIRAQLVHLPSGEFEQDFVIKKYSNSTHILNAVSPGWTSALPFGKWVSDLIKF
jgi:(S)-2-hydroxyglutarate dehydrogenase